jgi:uncharacterized protein
LNQAHIAKISAELSLRANQVEAAAELLDGGATVPFIARYRKEATGSLDEVAVMAIRDRLGQLKELDDRRESIIKSLEERELLTDELKEQIMQAETMTILEDIYLPYRPKRRTRATIAREKGLEPLAEMILAQDRTVDPAAEAVAFVDQDKGIESAEEALAGARDIRRRQRQGRRRPQVPGLLRLVRAGLQGAIAQDSGHAQRRQRGFPETAGRRARRAGLANTR